MPRQLRGPSPSLGRDRQPPERVTASPSSGADHQGRRARDAAAPNGGTSAATVAEALEAVRRLVRALRIAANRAHDTVGISSAELFVLRALEEGGPASSLNELAARTYTDQSSASPIVARLQRRRLVRRQRAAVDRRRMLIDLTERGRSMLRRAPEAPQASVVTALRRMPTPERTALARGLSHLVAEMGWATARAAMLFEEPARRSPRRRASPASMESEA